MEKHEKRNEQPPIAERPIELLVYGVFTAYEGDKGEYMAAWVELPDILMSISRETVVAKLASFRDGLSRALDAALLVPSPAVPPAVPRDTVATSPSAASEVPA